MVAAPQPCTGTAARPRHDKPGACRVRTKSIPSNRTIPPRASCASTAEQWRCAHAPLPRYTGHPPQAEQRQASVPAAVRVDIAGTGFTRPCPVHPARSTPQAIQAIPPRSGSSSTHVRPRFPAPSDSRRTKKSPTQGGAFRRNGSSSRSEIRKQDYLALALNSSRLFLDQAASLEPWTAGYSSP